MFTESPIIMEYVFKTVVSVGISVMIFILKDFKSSMKDLTDNLNKLTIVVTTLIEKDIGREKSITELKSSVEDLELRLANAEREVLRLDLLRRGRS